MDDGCEILIDDGTMSRRGRRMLDAMIAAAPAGTVTSSRYTARHRLLMMYGAGLEPRRIALERHRAAGGRVIVWDLGYWEREEGGMRLSVDSLHPSAAQLAMAPAEGTRYAVALREDAKASGPIMLVGLGTKSCALYGLQPMEWERTRFRKLLRQFPGRHILWRPKGRRFQALPGATLCHGVPVEDALRGCSLVVCRHSNVAIDACIAGVPVECDDGAARALYRGNREPTREQRAEFLRRLGWFNWQPGEAGEAWRWIERLAHA
jgi:hypothetical protein